MVSVLIVSDMFTSVVVLLLTTLSLADDSIQYPQHPFRVVCHTTLKDGSFTVANAETALPMCTHLVYNYIHIHGSNFQVYSRNPTLDFGETGITQMVAFKKQFPYLKTMIGVGGTDDRTEYYSQMAATLENRATFVDSVVQFVLDHGLDGMDFYWPTPGYEDLNDRPNFVKLVKELRQQFDKHYLILSLTLTGLVPNTYRGIEPRGLGEQAHFINLQTFNFNQRGRSHLCDPISPLRSDVSLNVRDSLTFYQESGVPLHKINIGISSDCKNCFLLNGNETGVVMGRPIREDSTISYYEFCKLIEGDEGWGEEWHWDSLTPYSRKGDRVVSHENARSVEFKVLDAIRYEELGGIAYYGLDKDDFKGHCVASGGKFPMLRVIDKQLVDATNAYYVFVYFSKDKSARYYWNLANNKVLRGKDAEIEN